MSSATALAVPLARGPLIGTFLGLVLYGVTCMQAFFYFRTYDRDSRGLKMTVALLVVLETVHAVMTMWVMDNYLIVEYANMQALESPNWSSASTYVLGLLIDFHVYLYFTWRIWLFTKRTWIIVLMLALSISRTAISIAACVLSAMKPTWQNYLDTTKALLAAGNVLFIIGDAFSACTMAYHLRKFKSWAYTLSPDRPRRIDILLNRLLIFAVATGAVTLLVDVVALILSLSQPQSLAFLSAILIQTRLYANSLLASLNIRNATSRAYEEAPTTPIELPVISLRFARPSDLSTALELDVDGEHGLVHDAIKSDVESWRTTQAQR